MDEGTSCALSGGEFEGVGEELDGGGDLGDQLSIDLDTLMHILQESSDPSLDGLPDDSDENLEVGSPPGTGNHEKSTSQNEFQLEQPSQRWIEYADPVELYPSSSQEALHATVGAFGLSFESGVSSDVEIDDVQLEASPQVSSPVQAYPVTKKCCSQGLRDHAGEKVGVSQSLLPGCSTSSFAGADFDHVGDLDCNVLPGGSGTQCRNLPDASCGPSVDNLDGGFRYCDSMLYNSLGLSKSENASRKSMEVMFVDADVSSHASISNKSDFYNNSGVTDEFDVNYSVMPFRTNKEDTYSADFPYYYSSGVFDTSLLPGDVVTVADEISRFQNLSDYSVSQTSLIDHSALKEMNSNYVPYSKDEFHMDGERDEMGEFHTQGGCSVSQTSLADCSYEKTMNNACEGSNNTSPMDGSFTCNADNRFVDKASIIPCSFTWPGVAGKQEDCIDNGNNDELAAGRSMTCFVPKALSEVDGKYFCSRRDDIYTEEDLAQSSSGIASPIQNLRYAVYTMGETVAMNTASEKAGAGGISDRYLSGDLFLDLNLNDSELGMKYAKPSGVSNRRLSRGKDEDKGNVIYPEGFSSLISSSSPESIQSNLSGSKSFLDNDSDMCILEDISQPVSLSQSVTPGKHIQSLQRARHSDSVPSVGVGGTRFKTTDERIIFQAALQDLGQPKSEASPPDGVLAVPLLRHQRIALSWMVQKETSSFYCSGGILADDQGLGKTVSTIALILTERPSRRVDPNVAKSKELETLDLDGDDEVIEIDGKTGVCEIKGKTKEFDSIQVTNQSSVKRLNSFTQSKESPALGRPAAGTLVVCPTSVLRQWADELQKKVTSEANLTVFVYHGANRTKDPGELAKYDVVLTTYAIVSMEVSKQTFDDEDDEEKGKLENGDVSLLGLTFGKKRKYPPSSSKKASKSKKVLDSTALNSMARPLAKVRWFRVVLDEAQSIKNHRTQVARACWGLRAKRRWCLSGTPVQNAIDDLYSYFRFLRYDPYSVYNSFCSTIKGPIQRNPKVGYSKLQAVLKTIMLRRTKGTLLDGEPIIKLPPKVVELKKVEFTVAERDFYTRLEADSRAQFKEYADAGTVKQNYVNILLMLLRLRQACDHPLLVRGVDTSSLGKSSVEMAKKLPREKQICLLNCLQGSLAICGICSDPPEDAVVSVCGHVFCNQCICEHLCGDDKQCPGSSCKVPLSASSVFSKATLDSSLSDQPVQESSDCEINSYSEESSFDSSKIRAALEVLQSLTKPQDCTSMPSSAESSFQGNATCVENSVGSGGSINDNIGKGNTSTNVVSKKAIVFSQWTRMLDLLEARLKSCSIQYRRLDGTMSVAARDKAVKDFNTLPEISVMIMSLKAASLGLNMVAACHVLLLDLWWNPTTEDQAIDRAHRIGQTRPVTVLRLTVKNTVEDRILALQQKKREMVSSAFGEDENGGRQTRLTLDDLNYLFMV